MINYNLFIFIIVENFVIKVMNICMLKIWGFGFFEVYLYLVYISENIGDC